MAPGRSCSFSCAWFCVQLPLMLIWRDGLRNFPLYTVGPELPDLTTRLRRTPSRSLSSNEREAFKRDGVVLLPKVITDKRIFPHFEGFPSSDWRRTHGGAMRALVWQGPLAGIAASALGVESVRVFEASVWCVPLNLPFKIGSVGNWHQDYTEDEDGKMIPIVTTWLSLSSKARALEFALGSHKHSVVKHCARTHEWQIWYMPDDCVRQVYHNRTQAYIFDPGDVVVFQGQVLHQGINQGEHRVGIAIRWVAANAQYSARLYQSNTFVESVRHMPQECSRFSGPLFPLVYPRENTTPGAEQNWPVAPTLFDYLVIWKAAVNFSHGNHRSLPLCSHTWDSGADL